MASLQDILNAVLGLQSQMSSMQADIKDLKSQVGSVDLRMSSLESQVGSVDLRMSSLESQVGEFKEDFEKQIPNLEKAGSTFEIVARGELRMTRGFEFSRQFVVKELAGLARLALPKEAGVDFTGWHGCL
jgi:septal ring factor EnvC (AmiA/AmiB activator)